MTTYVYRVRWRRTGWTSATKDKSRIFERESEAARFVAKLLGDDRPDLTPLALLKIHRRPVGDWEEVHGI